MTFPFSNPAYNFQSKYSHLLSSISYLSIFELNHFENYFFGSLKFSCVTSYDIYEAHVNESTASASGLVHGGDFGP